MKICFDQKKLLALVNKTKKFANSVYDILRDSGPCIRDFLTCRNDPISNQLTEIELQLFSLKLQCLNKFSENQIGILTHLLGFNNFYLSNESFDWNTEKYVPDPKRSPDDSKLIEYMEKILAYPPEKIADFYDVLDKIIDNVRRNRLKCDQIVFVLEKVLYCNDPAMDLSMVAKVCLDLLQLQCLIVRRKTFGMSKELEEIKDEDLDALFPDAFKYNNASAALAKKCLKDKGENLAAWEWLLKGLDDPVFALESIFEMDKIITESQPNDRIANICKGSFSDNKWVLNHEHSEVISSVRCLHDVNISDISDAIIKIALTHPNPVGCVKVLKAARNMEGYFFTDDDFRSVFEYQYPLSIAKFYCIMKRNKLPVLLADFNLIKKGKSLVVNIKEENIEEDLFDVARIMQEAGILTKENISRLSSHANRSKIMRVINEQLGAKALDTNILHSLFLRDKNSEVFAKKFEEYDEPGLRINRSNFKLTKKHVQFILENELSFADVFYVFAIVSELEGFGENTLSVLLEHDRPRAALNLMFQIIPALNNGIMVRRGNSMLFIASRNDRDVEDARIGTIFFHSTGIPVFFACNDLDLLAKVDLKLLRLSLEEYYFFKESEGGNANHADVDIIKRCIYETVRNNFKQQAPNIPEPNSGIENAEQQYNFALTLNILSQAKLLTNVEINGNLDKLFNYEASHHSAINRILSKLCSQVVIDVFSDVLEMSSEGVEFFAKRLESDGVEQIDSFESYNEIYARLVLREKLVSYIDGENASSDSHLLFSF